MHTATNIYDGYILIIHKILVEELHISSGGSEASPVALHVVVQHALTYTVGI